VDLCEDTLSDALEKTTQSISLEIDQEIGFFASLFFNPSNIKLGLIVIILFVFGFIVGSGIVALRR